MLAFRFEDGNSFSILDSKPAGQTTLADTHTAAAETIVDENLRCGSLFAEQKGEILKVGFAYPGSEGEFTYRGVTYPDGRLHQWRKRYHPIKDGLTQTYTVAFEQSHYPDFQTFYSSDKHYFDVAKILLHNTKGMLALPGRQYQYRAPGWIQEHWSLAPPRGKGLLPGWLPWVTTSALNGICETEAFDNALFEELKKP